MLKKLSIIALLMLNNIAMADNNIAIVNTDKIKTDTKAGQYIAQKLNDLQTKFKEKVDKLTQEFDKQKQELDKQKTVLSKEAFAKKENEFNTKLADSRKALQKEAANLEQMQQKALSDFNALARSVIDDIVKEGKYLHVLPSEIVIYADPKSDVTSQVIAGIDKKTDKIEVTAPTDNK